MESATHSGGSGRAEEGGHGSRHLASLESVESKNRGAGLRPVERRSVSVSPVCSVLTVSSSRRCANSGRMLGLS